MSPSPAMAQAQAPAPTASPVARPMARLDLREVVCPLTWVRTRLALSRLARGEAVEVLLADGEPRENVPRSAEEEGHRVRRLEPAPEEGAGIWRAWIERGDEEAHAWP